MKFFSFLPKQAKSYKSLKVIVTMYFLLLVNHCRSLVLVTLILQFDAFPTE